MKTNALNPDDDVAPADPSPTALFNALSDTRRQYLLEYLVHKPESVVLGDVAEYIAIKEDEPTRDRYERILVGLHHVHVPQLVDAGIVRYDADRELVRLSVDPGDIRPFLRHT